MPEIGLRAAARLCGRNQSTVHRALKAGRLSYTRNGGGERRIDVAELERVFGLAATSEAGASAASGAEGVQSNSAHAGALAALERLLDDRDATIRDLRTRLDASETERRQLTALLNPPARRSWWRRWRR
jgi:hypothetical protein